MIIFASKLNCVLSALTYRNILANQVKGWHIGIFLSFRSCVRKALTFEKYGFKCQRFIAWLFSFLSLWTLVMVVLFRKPILPIYWPILGRRERSSKITSFLTIIMCPAAHECVCVYLHLHLCVFWRMIGKGKGITIVLSCGTF